MHRMKLFGGLLLILVGGCSSTERAEAECGDISGNWKIASSRTDGTCDGEGFGDSEDTITIRQADDGSWLVVFPGVEGGCPGDFNSRTCKFIANCGFTSKTGATVATVGIDWKFDGSKLSGSEVASVSPPAVPAACTATYSDSGTKL